MLRVESAKTLGDWIFEDILCRWGSLREIVTDNGSAFLKAMDYMSKRYHVDHIRISGYNSRANGIVERSHFDVRQSLFKAVDGDEKRWSTGAYSVFWAERITVKRRMGCSPYFAATGAHPLIPMDISEATYLQPPPTSVLSTTDLIARRAIALQKRTEHINMLFSKVYSARLKAAKRFEKEHGRTIHDYDFKQGSLVLVRNTQIEKSLNRKMRARYMGPLIVVSRNYGGAYIICELDGTVFHRPIAAFRVIPYFARKKLSLPKDFLDIDTARLRELESTDDIDDEENESPSSDTLALNTHDSDNTQRIPDELVSDVVVYIRPEFGKYKLDCSVKRLWLFETGLQGAITTVIEIGSAQRPGDIQDPSGFGNDMFDAGLKGCKFAYRIYGAYKLQEPITRQIAAHHFGFTFPESHFNAPAWMTDGFPLAEMERLF
jgi:hypothetical protein